MKNRALIYLALSGLVFLGGGAGAFMLFGSLGEKSNELAKLKADAKQPAELQQQIETLTQESQATGAKLAHLEQGIPEVAYIPTMLKELEAFGAKNGVKVYGVRPFIAPQAVSKKDAKKKAEKPYTELTIEIKGKGRYGAALQFVKAMTTFPKIVAVRTVTLTPKVVQGTDSSKGYSNLDITIELRAFLFKPKDGETVGFPEAPASQPTDPMSSPERKGIPSSAVPDSKPADSKEKPVKTAGVNTHEG